MAVMIKGGFATGDTHSCLEEIGVGKYDGVYDRHELKVGSICRCSCGILWRARSYAYTLTKWEEANWWYRLLHYGKGREAKSGY